MKDSQDEVETHLQAVAREKMETKKKLHQHL
jgi:hypothetical protein